MSKWVDEWVGACAKPFGRAQVAPSAPPTINIATSGLYHEHAVTLTNPGTPCVPHASSLQSL